MANSPFSNTKNIRTVR